LSLPTTHARERRELTAEEVRPLELLAGGEAVVAEQARLHQLARETVEREQNRAHQLRMLADASLAVIAALTLEARLQIITDEARTIVGAHQAVTSVTEDENWAQAFTTVSLSEAHAAWREYDAPLDGSGIYTLVCRENRPMRMTQAELEAHPAWHGFGSHAAAHPPMRGWLAAPLMGRDGRNLGLIQLSDKYTGEFTGEDEALLVQLAQLASVAVENLQLQERATAAAAALEADRLKTDLLNAVTHELRTPLAAIKGFTSAMQTFFAQLSPEELQDFLREIDTAAGRLQELIDNLLQLSRIESGGLELHRERVAASTVIEPAVDEARRRFADRVIALDIDEGLPLIDADVPRLGQVIANLIDNAVKYSPGGGEVRVFARTATDGGVRLSISDHGIGIPPEHVGRVFERFYRVDTGHARQVGGTGLGLAMCKRIVDAHGGHIIATSREGEGSTFTVTLPPA
jgi:signal transduction histidine kinase